MPFYYYKFTLDAGFSHVIFRDGTRKLVPGLHLRLDKENERKKYLNPKKGGFMAEEIKVGCARPTGGPVGESAPEPAPETATEKKEVKSMIQVGRKAPDFTAPGYQKGKFVNIKLSDYLGKWVLLCFYPGDFTFV